MLGAAAHLLLPFYVRWGTRDDERRVPLPGDEIVAHPHTGYTLAVTIEATPSEIWPWLAQMGQGRAGFYTLEWVETVMGADIHNADRLIPVLQRVAPGDTIRLTPDPYLGQPGQFMTVAAMQPERALVFRQTLPNGTVASWALVIRPEDGHAVRLVTRRCGGPPTVFDRVMRPGYALMDRGVLRGIRARAETTGR